MPSSAGFKESTQSSTKDLQCVGNFNLRVARQHFKVKILLYYAPQGNNGEPEIF